MSRPGQFRRAVVALESGSGSPALPMIGNRSLHQCWALLKAHFRGVLLAPQSLSDGASTQWTWREPVDAPPLTAAELITVRKRLAGAQRALADSVEDAPESAADPRRTGSVLPQLQAHMESVVTALIAQPDAALAAYVARSEQGLLLHSWGLPAALTPRNPDDTDCEIAGTVLVAGQPAPDREVLLENSDGAILDRSRSDAAGRFRFSKIAPGRYRARAVSDRETFPLEGVIVEVERISVTGLELRDRGDHRPAAAPRASSRRRRAAIFVLLGSLALVVIGILYWRRSEDPSPASVATTKSPEQAEMAAKAPAPAHVEQVEPPAPRVSRAAEIGSSRSLPKPTTAEAPSTRKSTRRPTVVAQQRVAGVGIQASGPPTSTAAPSPVASTSAVHNGTAGNGSAAAGPGASGNPSPTAAASASGASSAAVSRSATAAASPAAAVAVTATPPAPSPHPTSPSAPKPAAVAAATRSPTPMSPPAAESARTATVTNNDAASAKTESVAAGVAASAEPDRSGDKSPTPDVPDSPSDNQPADRSPVSAQTAMSSDATTTDESVPARPPSASPTGDQRDDSVATSRVTHHPLRVRIRLARWQPRLLRDAILPTAPARVGDDDAIEALRERLMRERQTQIPLLLKQPAVQIGFAIELPADMADALGAHWDDASDASPARATLVGGRAEISWPGNPPPGTTGKLLAHDGRELARITADERGELTLLADAGVRGWPWIGVERPRADDARLSATDWTTRLEWRVLSGAPAAPTWQRDDHWLKDHGHRLDLALGPRASDPAYHALALVDRVTGWALANEIEQTQETSATAVAVSR